MNTSTVVGVDGSPGARLALDWAAADAARRNRPLRIVHADLWPALAAPLASPPRAMYDMVMQRMAEEILQEAVARAGAAAPGIDITTDMPIQQPAAALLEAARGAALLVVGNRGLGGFTGLLVGSVAVQVAAHAEIPVVVVHGPAGADASPEAGRVVVAVDEAHDSEHALAFAFEQAASRALGLTVVHAYRWPVTLSDDLPPLTGGSDRLDDDEQWIRSETIAGWSEKYPDVHVRTVLIHGRAASALIKIAAGAELLVVGCRGHGALTGLLAGSVSQAAIHHAACPVAVVK